MADATAGTGQHKGPAPPLLVRARGSTRGFHGAGLIAHRRFRFFRRSGPGMQAAPRMPKGKASRPLLVSVASSLKLAPTRARIATLVMAAVQAVDDAVQ